MELIYHRLANLLHLSYVGVDKLWNIVKEVKLSTTFDKPCGGDGLFDIIYGNGYISFQVNKLEKNVLKELGSNNNSFGSALNATFENITAEDLETAVKMFIYLNTCPGELDYSTSDFWRQWFKTWLVFYNDLFESKTPDLIILTLNRMAKSGIHNSNDLKISEKLFKRTTELLDLKYKEIQTFIPGFGRNVTNVTLESDGM